MSWIQVLTLTTTSHLLLTHLQLWLGLAFEEEYVQKKIHRLTKKCYLCDQSCLTLCDPMDCSLPGSTVHGLLKARLLEWVAMPFCRRWSWSMDWTQLSCMAGRLFTGWATRGAWYIEHLWANQLTDFSNLHPWRRGDINFQALYEALCLGTRASRQLRAAWGRRVACVGRKETKPTSQLERGSEDGKRI